jgi:hypothetical protein
VRLRRYEDIEPAFTEQEFEEVMLDQAKKAPLRMTVSSGRLELMNVVQEENTHQNQNDSVIRENESTGKHREVDNESNLFDGLLSTNTDNVLEIKARKMAQKKAIISKMKQEALTIKPF